MSLSSDYFHLTYSKDLEMSAPGDFNRRFRSNFSDPHAAQYGESERDRDEREISLVGSVVS
jgi:hypothetical protein